MARRSSATATAAPGVRGTYWRSAGGLVGLPSWPGAQVASGATAISSDAATVVGFANTSATSESQKQAMRWTGTNYATIHYLGSLPGASFLDSRAFAVTNDGAIIVGVANDENDDDAAFVWDAAHGMRKLATVLTTEYGLNLAGWRLVDARGVRTGMRRASSRSSAPASIPAAIRRATSRDSRPTACNDGLDNDGDGHTDFAADPGCTRLADRSEVADCADGLDQDGDGPADFPADTQCSSAADATEQPDCSDGIDSDGDALVDFPADPGCRNAAGLVENPACSDGIDNEIDGATDFPADTSCVAADDKSEIADCNDGIDNDGDGQTDFPSDTDCQTVGDGAEDPQCSDRVDNDVDGRADYPIDHPDCASATDTAERPACRDGIDNDGDGFIDAPADTGCLSASSAAKPRRARCRRSARHRPRQPSALRTRPHDGRADADLEWRATEFAAGACGASDGRNRRRGSGGALRCESADRRAAPLLVTAHRFRLAAGRVRRGAGMRSSSSPPDSRGWRGAKSASAPRRRCSRSRSASR